MTGRGARPVLPCAAHDAVGKGTGDLRGANSSSSSDLVLVEPPGSPRIGAHWGKSRLCSLGRRASSSGGGF